LPGAQTKALSWGSKIGMAGIGALDFHAIRLFRPAFFATSFSTGNGIEKRVARRAGAIALHESFRARIRGPRKRGLEGQGLILIARRNCRPETVAGIRRRFSNKRFDALSMLE